MVNALGKQLFGAAFSPHQSASARKRAGGAVLPPAVFDAAPNTQKPAPREARNGVKGIIPLLVVDADGKNQVEVGVAFHGRDDAGAYVGVHAQGAAIFVHVLDHV